MTVISTQCPYCETANTSFTGVSEKRSVQDPYNWTVFLCCNHCDSGIAVTIRSLGGASPLSFTGDLSRTESFEVLRISPQPPLRNVPEHLPPNISRLYIQSSDNLKLKHWDASGAMSRKILDITAASYSKKNTLKEKIDELDANRIITPQLTEWSHSIRLDGNDAAHETEYTEDEAKTLFNFMHMFVLYLYTMPGMLNARKEDKKMVTSGASLAK